MWAELVGWRRGTARQSSSDWASTWIASDLKRPWAVGAVATAFGSVEAQRRRSLHPHILAWLLLTEFQELLASAGLSQSRRAVALVDAASYRFRCILEESAVTELPKSMCERNFPATACLDEESRHAS